MPPSLSPSFTASMPISQLRPSALSHIRPPLRSAHACLSTIRCLCSRSESTIPNPLILHRHNNTIHLLGTMHIAQASATAARDLIRREYTKHTLGAVFLELDPPRFQRLRKRAHNNPDHSLLSLALSILSRPSTKPLASLVELAIGAVYRTLHRLGFASGVEFEAAIETAERLGVPIVLGDQHIDTTMANVADGFKRDFELARLLSLVTSSSTVGAVGTDVERGVREAFAAVARGDVEGGQRLLAQLVDPKTVREMTRSMREFAPGVTEAILDERDVVMVDNLIRCVDHMPQDKSSVVAVVGLAHVEGIEREWRRRNAMVREAISPR
eukprot:GFKZ01003368.1.p1 GENE.GFKZ01003368.1~~GFKZ01003368.1.p1  ORF type:complete len:327 (+),score=48.77 GFKZ01003368.1:1792-2772(+)